MKKEFQKPILKQYALRLNENIAASWKYYFSEGTYKDTYSFTHLDPNNSSLVVTNLQGCFGYLMGNMGWATDSYEATGKPNLAMYMSAFLLDTFLIPEYETDQNSHYITDCYHTNINISPTPSS